MIIMKNLVEMVITPKRKSLGRFSLCGTRYHATASESSQKKFRSKNKAGFFGGECVNGLKSKKPNNAFAKLVPTPASRVQADKPRKNKVNIQMLSENLHRQIFRRRGMEPSDQSLDKSIETLMRHGLWSNKTDFVKDVSIDLPRLEGETIEDHFRIIGEQQCGPYRNVVNKLIKQDLPKCPKEWVMQKGWTKYQEGKPPVRVPCPEGDALIFDVEVCVKLGDLPTLATAASGDAWYGWVSSNLADGVDVPPTHFYDTSNLIPMESKGSGSQTKRVIIGHNVSYDRARVKEQYRLDTRGVRFLDTMSLHICVGGINSNQKSMLKRSSNENEVDAPKTFFCLSSLKELYNLYCKKELTKEKRNVFLEGTLLDVKNDFQNLMSYCANDVAATFEILQVLFPVFLERFPHPVTLAGILEMGNAVLPVNSNWTKFLTEADQTYDDLKHEMRSILSKKSDYACRLQHDEDYKKDLWMWDQDWSTQSLKLTKKKVNPSGVDGLRGLDDDNGHKFRSLFDMAQVLPKVKPFLPGYPLWYRKLCDRSDPAINLTMSMLVTPKLLQMTWEKYPLYHIREFGWGILVADLSVTDPKTSIPFDQLREITLKNCNLTEEDVQALDGGKLRSRKKVHPPPYYKGAGIWCNHVIDDCCFFFKLPHKNGPSKNVGNPLSKDFTQLFSSTFLAGSDETSKRVIDLGMKLSYWRNNRERITNQMVVWLNKKEIQEFNADEDESLGLILPRVVVCGTITRRALESTWLTASKVVENRIGSELRSIIQAPPGYHIVGADVDSQELWIASLIGDSNDSGVHGSTPFGWMTLSGTKASGTDMHSMTAKAVGISRDHAKVINYARIYGAGVKFAQKLLQQFNPSMSDAESQKKAEQMYKLTKGVKVFRVKKRFQTEFATKFGVVEVNDLGTAYKLSQRMGKKVGEVFESPFWSGGTESAMFNRLEEIASALQPKTPFLSGRLSCALEPQFKGDQYHMNTRVNWVVQSGAVDFLHLMLVCMRWLTNGQARYCFSFHDEVRYLFPSEKRYAGALAVHLTNLLVRSFCAHRLGMYDLPQSVAFFSSVEVDKVLRKEATDNCITPSNPHGLERGYGVPPGESLDIYQAVEKSGGKLSVFSQKNQVKGEIVKVLRPDYIRYLKKESAWPAEFDDDANDGDDGVVADGQQDDEDGDLFVNTNQNYHSDNFDTSSSDESE